MPPHDDHDHHHHHHHGKQDHPHAHEGHPHEHGDTAHGRAAEPGDDFVPGCSPRYAALERGDGIGQQLYIDAFSGIAGDMLVSALVDLGVPVAVLEEALSQLPLADYRLEFGSRVRQSIRGTALKVHVTGSQPQRDYATIRAMLEDARGLPDGARALSLRAFRVLAEAEASVHGTDIDAVHFHEVGAVDSIVDTVAACVGIDFVGADVTCSPLPLSRGFTRSQHGRIPLPAPATALCLTGVPTVASGLDRELVTPTGACLIKAIARDFGPWPSLAPTRIAFGAGTRQLQDRPNLVRLVLGEPDPRLDTDSLIQLEANVDDASGEVIGHAMERLLAAGALDCWCTPIGMKKGRPATLVACLVRPEQRRALTALMLAETTSLGVRVHRFERTARPRRMVTVTTPFGEIGLKVADSDGLPANIAPEYEHCRRAAETHGVPLKHVLQAALQAYQR